MELGGRNISESAYDVMRHLSENGATDMNSVKDYMSLLELINHGWVKRVPRDSNKVVLTRLGADLYVRSL